MNFGWINLVNAVMLILLLLPNVAAAVRHKMPNGHSESRGLNIAEQVGRYGCMIWMVIPLLVKNGEFGFSSVVTMELWIVLSALCLLAYYIGWIRLFKKGESLAVNLALAIWPSLLFIINGILLHHVLLAACGLIFGVSHVMITRESSN